MADGAKKIFITGAASGIGAATTQFFLEKGWTLGGFDLHLEALRSLKQRINTDNLHIFEGDVCNAEDIDRALTAFCGENGTLDVLINNAGILRVGPFEEIGLETNKKIIDINFAGVLTCTDRALPYLKRAEQAQIINLSSASSLYGNPELTVYAATKAAVRSLTEGWSMALEKYGIHVCDIAPMYVRSPMIENTYSGFKALRLKDVHLTPEDVAKVIWSATKRKKLHWYVGWDTKIFVFLRRIMPDWLARKITMRVIGYK